MVGIPLTTLAYVLANVGYLAVLSTSDVMASHAVAVVRTCTIVIFIRT